MPVGGDGAHDDPQLRHRAEVLHHLSSELRGQRFCARLCPVVDEDGARDPPQLLQRVHGGPCGPSRPHQQHSGLASLRQPPHVEPILHQSVDGYPVGVVADEDARPVPSSLHGDGVDGSDPPCRVGQDVHVRQELLLERDRHGASAEGGGRDRLQRHRNVCRLATLVAPSLEPAGGEGGVVHGWGGALGDRGAEEEEGAGGREQPQLHLEPPDVLSH
mmetsp:Transcript_9637/g.32263  ORF Transcript_9637/g.32263 Transcript_9637/m.32263 type:complete len:217 (+) Transcript_9637:270-920(+)